MVHFHAQTLCPKDSDARFAGFLAQLCTRSLFSRLSRRALRSGGVGGHDESITKESQAQATHQFTASSTRPAHTGVHLSQPSKSFDTTRVALGKVKQHIALAGMRGRLKRGGGVEA